MAWYNINFLSLNGLSRFAKSVFHNRLQIVHLSPVEGIVIAFLVAKVEVIFGDNFLDDNFIFLILDVYSRITNLYT